MHPALLALLGVGGGYFVYKKIQSSKQNSSTNSKQSKPNWASFQLATGAGTNIVQRLGLQLIDEPRRKRDLTAVEYEKYEDPLYRCFANFPDDGSPYDPHYKIDNTDTAGDGTNVLKNYSLCLQNPSSIGYEYLNEVPPSAQARVNAMRQKIEKFALDNLAPVGTVAPADGSKIDVSDYVKYISGISSIPSDSLHPVLANSVQGSVKQVIKLVDSISRVSKDPSKIGDLAKSMGIDVTQIQKDVDVAKSILSTIDAATQGGATQLLTEAGETIVNYIGTAISSVLEDIGVDVASLLPDLAEVAGDVASIVPIAGAIVKVIIDLVKILSSSGNDNAAICKEMTDRIQNIYLKGYNDTAYQLPIPWHLFQTWKPDCPDGAGVWLEYDNPARPTKLVWAPDRLGGGGATGFITEVLRSRFEQFNNLPKENKIAIKKWWSMAQAAMSHPEVFKIFVSMCNDSMGGTMANDEQVMCVAAPIAIANGFDIDGFAKLLWAYSKGYEQHNDVVTRDPNGILSCFHADSADPSNPIIAHVYMRDWSEPRSGAIPPGYDVSAPTDEASIDFWNKTGGTFLVPNWENGAKYGLVFGGKWIPYCPNAINNAWVANWGTLCVDAFELATRIKQSNRRHRKPLTNLVDVEV
jgi:hypothetical protein